jgi:hypothetical protein
MNRAPRDGGALSQLLAALRLGGSMFVMLAHVVAAILAAVLLHAFVLLMLRGRHLALRHLRVMRMRSDGLRRLYGGEGRGHQDQHCDFSQV